MKPVYKANISEGYPVYKFNKDTFKNDFKVLLSSLRKLGFITKKEESNLANQINL